MSEDIKNVNDPENAAEGNQPEIIVNDLGTKDATVVVEEDARTVVLTEDETIVIDKTPDVFLAPPNRPRKVYSGMWGKTQISVVGAGLLALIASLLLYLFLVVPSDREIETNRLESQRLEAELISSREKYGDITNTQEQVSKLISSIDDFETRFLPRPDLGRAALYQRLNGLIQAYGLVNSTGPDYVPLELAEQGKSSSEDSGRAKYRSLYPGTYVTMTVEGNYQNLRRFIREIETSNEFVVISAIELEPSTSSDTKQVPAPAGQPVAQGISGSNETLTPQTVSPRTSSKNQGVNRGQVVSLRLEMAAYFRRPTASAELPPSSAQ